MPVKCDTPQIDISAIPSYVPEIMAPVILDAVREYFQMPGVMEKFRKWESEQNAKEKRNEISD